MIDAINREFGNHPTESVDEYLYIFPEPELDLTTDDAPPVSRLANLILIEAVHLRADRVHIFPDGASAPVRFRIDEAQLGPGQVHV